MFSLRSLLLVCCLGAILGGCLNPCDQLADRICECEETELQRQQCQQRVEIQKQQRDASEKNKADCEAALVTCTCQALDDGNLAACGFVRE